MDLFVCKAMFNETLIPYSLLKIPTQQKKAECFGAKVHATKCTAFASSSINELRGSLGGTMKRGLLRAAQSKYGNAERDLHRLFKKEGLSLPIGTSTLDVGDQQIKYLSLKTWHSYLLNYHSKLMLGGFDIQDPTAQILLRVFWENFQKNFGDHAVFDLHQEQGHLGKCVPYYLHIDEGVGLRRSAVLVVAMQCVFGRETAKIFGDTHSQDGSMDHRMTISQYHNAKGSTYLTRFLFTALPKKSYTKKNSSVYWALLDVLAKECKQLMEQGVKVGSHTFYPICLGLKGDQPALIKSGAFKRSFMNLGYNKGCCWECLAGYNGIPFEDCGENPCWAATVGLVPPWVDNNQSPLASIPCQTGLEHAFWKRDPFHAFKQTLGGHFGASTLVMFAIDFGLWKVAGQSADVDSMFERAFQDFKFYVRHEWRGSVVNYTKSFTRQTLHFADHKKFPYARWKGSDQMLIIRWLRHVVLHGIVLPDSITRDGTSPLHFPLEESQRPFYQAVLEGCNGAINFFHHMHRSGVWLEREVAQQMSSNCKLFCKAFSCLALLCHEKGIARFHLEPCLHVFRHFAHDIDTVLVKPVHFAMSPSLCTCEMDEDFVGKISKTSRHVHAMSTNERTIDRYLLRCHTEFSRA